MEYRYFCPECYESLIASLTKKENENNEADLDSLAQVVSNLTGYVCSVVSIETDIRLSEATLDGIELERTLANYSNELERIYTEAEKHLIDLTDLNTKYFDQDNRVFTGSFTDAEQVKSFCMELTDYIFTNRVI